MKRTLTICAAMILYAGALVFVLRVSAADETPDQLIAKARSLVSYSLAGPFELRANLEIVQPNGKKQKGTYTLDWAAPDRFREEIHWPGYDEIKIASGTTLYIKRSEGQTPLRAFEIDQLMNVANTIDDIQREIEAHAKAPVAATEGTEKQSDGSAPNHTARNIDGVRATCETVPHATAGICVATSTGSPVEIDEFNSAGFQMMDYSQYTQVGPVYLARMRSYSDGLNVVIKATIKQAAQVKDFAPDIFTPPQDAQTLDWCDNETPPRRLPTKEPLPVTAEDFLYPEVLDLFVDANGLPTRATILVSGGASADAATRKLMNVARFTPAKCGSKSVKSESLYTLGALDFLNDMGDIPAAGEKGYGIPICTYCPSPRYSDEAFKRNVQGSVVLQVVITPDGRGCVIGVVKALGYGLDQAAINAIENTYQFKPAIGPDGNPAPVRMVIEVDFRLYRRY